MVVARHWILALCALAAPTAGVFMDLAGGESRCIGEEMEEESYGKFTFGVKVAPDVQADAPIQSNVQVTVTDPSRRTIFSARLDFDAPDVFALAGALVRQVTARAAARREHRRGSPNVSIDEKRTRNVGQKSSIGFHPRRLPGS